MNPEISAQQSSHDDDPQPGGITVEELFRDFQRLGKALTIKQFPERIGTFIGHTTNQWMEKAKKQPVSRMLFDTFWFEGEICILFASSNQGKSILAVQIGESISSGIPIPDFKMDADSQLVVYFDFEMSSKQFELRYCKEGGASYNWSNNLIRYELDPDAETPTGFKCFEDYVVHSIEDVISRTETKVLIIDNLTYLSTDSETAKSAAPLMKQLKELKSRYKLSVLILAHTPKRDASKPITQNDLQGSSRLMQFCDSSFAIGASTQGSDIKYLKQIKVRSAAVKYDADNVIVCQIQKDDNFLRLVPTGFSTEQEHLKSDRGGDKAELIAQIQELTSKGKTQREIADATGISASTVNRLLKSLKTI